MSRVYFIKPIGRDGPIKIGSSVCVDARLIELNVSSPLPLELLAETPNTQRLEFRLHTLFRAQRSHAEWFHVSDALSVLIASIVNGSFDPASVPHRIMPDPLRSGGKQSSQALRWSAKREKAGRAA